MWFCLDNAAAIVDKFIYLTCKIVIKFPRCLDSLQATLYVYEMKHGEMAVTKIEHPDPAAAGT